MTEVLNLLEIGSWGGLEGGDRAHPPAVVLTWDEGVMGGGGHQPPPSVPAVRRALGRGGGQCAEAWDKPRTGPGSLGASLPRETNSFKQQSDDIMCIQQGGQDLRMTRPSNHYVFLPPLETFL